MQVKLRLMFNYTKQNNNIRKAKKNLNKHNINTNNLIQISGKKIKIHWEVDFINTNCKPIIKPIRWPIKKPKKYKFRFPIFLIIKTKLKMVSFY